ncbi:MAG: DUF4124 domain-containing protein [Gammaproteobacteria bacterium]|nr:DUF4124 domain-containing protein [Gammaproteobacteria bacterium]MBU1414980.1 DUF4124 domain-containing protein [Gammaproteobacteria bacterium]
MRLAAIAALLVLPLVANAQVYRWKDASGKVHYSDQPPAERSIGSQRLAPPTSYSDDVEKATTATADKREEAGKQAKETAEKNAKVEQERAEEAVRQENCQRARQNLAGMESGQIRFRMSASGEREALDGDVREAELASARRAVETNCSPRPTATKK